MRRTFTHLYLPLLLYGIIVALKFRVESQHAGLWLIAGATLLIALAEFISEASDRVASRLFAFRLNIACAVLGIAAIVALGLGMQGATAMPSTLDLIRTVGVGLLVGGVIRLAFLASFRRRRQARSTYVVRLILLAAVGMLVWLVPTDLTTAQPAMYAVSVGGGFFLHYLWRRLDERLVKVARTSRRIMKPLEDPTSGCLQPMETMAAVHMANNQLRKARRLVDMCEGAMSLGMLLIKASLLIRRRQFTEAQALLSRELHSGTHAETHTSGLLHLLFSISSRELGHYADVSLALAAARRISGGLCYLGKLLSALWLAESLPMPHEPKWRHAEGARTKAQRELNDAIRLNLIPHAHPTLSAIVASTLPLSRVFVDDIQAYMLFKYGNMTASLQLLEACLDHDSAFAPAWLHLGEWHMTTEALARVDGDSEKARESARAKEFCFHVVLILEPTMSHCRRRALQFLRPAVPTPERTAA